MDLVLAPRDDLRVAALRVYRLAHALASTGDRSRDTPPRNPARHGISPVH